MQTFLKQFKVLDFFRCIAIITPQMIDLYVKIFLIYLFLNTFVCSKFQEGLQLVEEHFGASEGY